jgi:signal transduction histidine kinase
VESHGPSIPPDERAALFEHFMRAGGKKPSPLPGAHLGLYVAKGLIEAHGGRIWVDGGGPEETTRFHFTLPLDSQPSRTVPSVQCAAEAVQHAVSA